jgi:hypothetical protein
MIKTGSRHQRGQSGENRHGSGMSVIHRILFGECLFS